MRFLDGSQFESHRKILGAFLISVLQPRRAPIHPAYLTPSSLRILRMYSSNVA